MLEVVKRSTLWLVVVATIAALPIVVMGARSLGDQAGAKPTAGAHGPKPTSGTHGPKKSPKPTAAPSISPTDAPTTPPTTPPTAAPPVVLVGAGDIASCGSSGDEATANLLDSIPGTVFTLGDNVYDNGTAAEFASCYDPSWGRHRARTMPVPGNHDYNTAGATGYYGYFGAAAGDPAKGYYAYDAGAWRIYVLNSNCSAVGGCGAGSVQETWLRADLAANPRACVAAMWHHPRFSSGSHGSSATTQDLWQALYDFDAELVLAGHDHDYERFAPQTATGALDPTRGLVGFVVGSGGRSHYAIATPRSNSLARNDDTYGVLRLELGDGTWSSRFIPQAGKTYTDSASGTCH